MDMHETRREAVFDTYADARQEVARRSSEDAANGMVSKVVRSPYGGFAVRSWPVELLAEPELRNAVIDRKPAYLSQ